MEKSRNTSCLESEEVEKTANKQRPFLETIKPKKIKSRRITEKQQKMSSSNKNRNDVIYVGNIDPRVTKANLYELFVQLAPIKSINYPRDKLLQTYQGYAFIELINANNDVEYVVQAINNNISLYNRTLKVRRSNLVTTTTTTPTGNQTNATKNSKKQMDNNGDILAPIAVLFIKNLHVDITKDKLRNIANKFGEQYKDPEIITGITQPLKGQTSTRNTNCGKLFYKYYRDADQALNQLNQQIIMNKPITVEYSLKNDQQNYRPAAGSNRYGNEIDRLLNKEAENNGLL